jgi:hypothetical protein
MKIAPIGETGNARVRLKDVLPPIRKGCPKGHYYGEKHHLYQEEKHHHHFSEEARRRMSESHHGRVEMVLVGSCEGPLECGHGTRDEVCSNDLYVCPFFVFESLALYQVRRGKFPSITPIEEP